MRKVNTSIFTLGKWVYVFSQRHSTRIDFLGVRGVKGGVVGWWGGGVVGLGARGGECSS